MSPERSKGQGVRHRSDNRLVRRDTLPHFSAPKRLYFFFDLLPMSLLKIRQRLPELRQPGICDLDEGEMKLPQPRQRLQVGQSSVRHLSVTEIKLSQFGQRLQVD
ncbi:MAG TPA: hypothetical protein VFW87_02485 [Pirellulales bacterium]|nr:hypothetical protein [Pirellulales bacterium]